MSAAQGMPGLRRELEGTYARIRAALVERNFDGFLAAGGVPDGIDPEDARGEFTDMADLLLDMGYPDLGETEFADARRDGDAAAYYHYALTPGPPSTVDLMIVRFHLKDGAWVASGADHAEYFTVDAGGDVATEIARRLDDDPLFAVVGEAAAPAGPPPGVNLGLNALLNCFAYGYEVEVCVNGVDIGCGPGSTAMRLLGGPQDGSGAAPFVLTEGSNSISVRYTKIDPEAPDQLTVGLFATEEAPSFFLATSEKPSGVAVAGFVLPIAGPREVSPVCILDDDGRQAAFVHVSTADFQISTMLNGEQGPGIMGVPDTMVVKGAFADTNELTLRYRAMTAPAKFRAVIVTPRGVHHVDRVVESEAEQTETLIF